MNDASRSKLERLGLSPAEAQIYLALVNHGPLAASTIANATGIARTSVYPTLSSLTDKGLIEGGTGHGSKFAAIAPDEALSSLIMREKETLSEREEIAKELGQTLVPLSADAESGLDDSVQVLRTPQVIAERVHRLQIEAKRSIEGVVKAPILLPRSWNPAQRKAQQHGVHYKALYERSVIDDPKVAPYLQSWISGGEEARVYDGELPYKLVVFDSEVVLSILVKRSGQPAALLVRHVPFARTMSILFDYFWQQAEPLVFDGAKKRRRIKTMAGVADPGIPPSPPAVAASDGKTEDDAISRG